MLIMNFSGKKILLLGFVVVLLVAIPLTVLTLQKSQEVRSRATPATTLSFDPPTVSKKVGETFSVDIVVTPGSNQISFAKFVITYDQAKLATAGAGIVLVQPQGLEGQGLTSILEGPIFAPGTITLTASVGTDPQRAIQTTATQTSTKVATVTFKALAETQGSTTQIAFAPPPQSQLLSLASSDQVSENVLLPNNTPAQVTTGAGPTATPGPTSPASQNQPPVCTALKVDRTTSGVAPFSITFTADGNDPNGTVKKVTFDFGDGPVQDITQGGGIGSNSVSVQISHTYNNSGTFRAKATITDNNDAVSASSTSCEQTITVTGGPTATPRVGGGGTGETTPTSTPAATTALPSPTPTITQVITVPSVIPSPGPSETILGIGAVGAVLVVLGTLLFFAL